MSIGATVVPMTGEDRAPVEPVERSARLAGGGAFMLDAPITIPAIWGADGDVAWSKGEPLMIAGPQGLGKTNLQFQLMLRRAGVIAGDLLGMPVEPAEGMQFYLAADRPQQAARSGRRMVDEEDRRLLDERVRVWRGPLPFDLGKCERGAFAKFLTDECPGVSDVYIDSLKDVAAKLSDDEVGSRVNGEIQEAIAQGIEVVTGHHQRKSGSDNKRPMRLDDVFGSTWLTAGCGSVLLLWGEAGDAIVEVRHLKPPSGEVGPLKMIHDHEAGTVAIYEPNDLIALARAALGGGLTARVAAVALYGKNDPDANEVERARNKLKRHKGLEQVPSSSPAAFRPKAGS